MILRKLFRKLILGYRCSSEEYIRYLKTRGCKIGDNVIIYSPNTTVLDDSRPFLLTIGDSVKITAGVIILTHDFSYSVCRSVYHDLVNDCSRETVIGRNVFIGMNTVILPGTKIGNNCIIGAGSVVNGIFENNLVIAGNPAKVISTLEKFYLKRKHNSISDAFALANIIRQKCHREPTIKELGNYYWLYAPRDKKWLIDNKLDIAMSGDITDQIFNDFKNSTPNFEGFDHFLQASKNGTI